MAAAFIKIPAGSNPRFTVTVNNADGSPMDLSVLNGYAFSIFEQPGRPVAVFAKVPPAGSNWLSLDDYTDEANGVFKIIIHSAATSEEKNINTPLYAEILTQATSGAYIPLRKNPEGKEFIIITDSPTRKFTGF